MGIYLNPGNAGFQSIRKGMYIDKSELISYINQTLGTPDKLTCISRPRRFGKSFAAKMLCAYYDKSCNSKELFEGLKISKDPSFERYRNQYNVLYLDITWFISTAEKIEHTILHLQKEIIEELSEAFPYTIKEGRSSIPLAMADINKTTHQKFIIIIDEWDALFREAPNNTILQEEYLQLLRGLFKSGSQTDKMIEAAYMTGILPIKKYGTQSALTDFYEYTMVQPEPLEEYMGFTEAEVKKICEDTDMNFYELQNWYDGYLLGKNLHIYNPKSVLEAVKRKRLGSYWTQTETYESLKSYINSNWEHLKEDILSMLAGNKCKISTRKFQNDMVNIKSKDDVLTLLVHLGYLAYNTKTSEAFIPNLELSDEFKNAVEDSGWEYISDALRMSEKLLEATLAGNSDIVAKRIDLAHSENTSILSYNDENSLSCIIAIAYYCARKDYIIERELPAGKGFADLVFKPRAHTDKPAMIVELKWNHSAQGAIQQIKNQQYPKALEAYSGDVLLVGINYNKKSKKHTCVIETFQRTTP